MIALGHPRRRLVQAWPASRFLEKQPPPSAADRALPRPGTLFSKVPDQGNTGQ
jgi:hypothetical protein